MKYLYYVWDIQDNCIISKHSLLDTAEKAAVRYSKQGGSFEDGDIVVLTPVSRFVSSAHMEKV